MMTLDDRAADGKADSHAVTFRCIERVKELVHDLRVDPHAGVSNACAHAIFVLPFCSDQQLPRPIVHVNHRVRGVAEQVEDDLLELDTVAGHVREAVSEFRLKHDAISLKVTP